MHLFVGLAWLFAALAFESAIALVASRSWQARLISSVNSRALTIYLWHAAGLLAMYQLLWTDAHSALTRTLLGLPIVVSVTYLAVMLFGWLEDSAAGRGAGTAIRGGLPKPSTANFASGGVMAAGLLALVLTAESVIQEPEKTVQPGENTVPASGVGLQLRTRTAVIRSAAPERETVRKTEPVTAEELQQELVAWSAQWNMGGAAVTLRRFPGDTWSGTVGVQDDGSPFLVDDTYWTASVTKTFTAALIMRLYEQDLLSLDDSVSKYVPDFPNADQFTVRHLLQHTSGLVQGVEYPREALLEAAEAGLQFEPGTGFIYSGTGYQLLGLVIESIMKISYTRALHLELLDPLGLTSTLIDEELQPLPYSTHPYAESGFGLGVRLDLRRAIPGAAAQRRLLRRALGFRWRLLDDN